MIGKVARGVDAGRLLCYLYGPGRANEHTDPHLVAGFGDPAELEPEGRVNGSHDLRRPSGLLAQPIAAMYGSGYEKPVWHCSIRAAPGGPAAVGWGIGSGCGGRHGPDRARGAG